MDIKSENSKPGYKTAFQPSFVLRKEFRLPSDFHENILTLENKLLFEHNFEDISQLMKLYKLGAEFYSSLNTKKSLGYTEKIKDLLMNKSSLKSMERQNLKQGFHFKSRSDNKFAKHFPTEILSLKKSSSAIGSLDDPKSANQNKKNTLLNYKTMALKSQRPKLERINSLSKLSKGNLLFGSEIVEENESVIEVEGIISNKKEELEKLCQEAIETVESDLKFQRKRFIERRNIKRRDYAFKATPSPEKRKTIFNPADIVLPDNFEIPLRGRANTISKNDKEDLRSKKVLAKSSSFIKKHPISNVFSDYFKKFHYLFFQTFCEKQINEALFAINNIYKKKLENYIFYEDQIKELELIMSGDGDTNEEQKNMIQNMVQAISLERDIKAFEIEKEAVKLMPNYKENFDQARDGEKWTQINEEFLNSFVEMLK